MSDEDKAKAEKLADEHWRWFNSVVGHVAKDFFVHGFKHGVETKRKRGKK